MKKSLILSALLLNSINLYAVEAGKFLYGVDYSNGSGEVKETTKTSDKTNSFDSTSTSLKIAYTLEDANRFVFSYEMMEKEFTDKSFKWYGKNKPELVFYNFDWQFTYPMESFSPYWTIGLATITLKDSASYLADGEDLEGVSFNYGAGLLYNLSSNIELELAYNCKSIGWENVGTTNTTETVSKLDQIEIGVNFIY